MSTSKTGGRRSKYIPELVEAICQTIRETGSDRLAYESHNLSHQTFYLWISKHPEFNEKVEKARQDFYRNKNNKAGDQKELAESFIQNTLAGKTFRWSMREVLDRHGNVHQLTSIEQVLPTPQILERVLGQVSEESRSLQVNIQIQEETFEESDNE